MSKERVLVVRADQLEPLSSLPGFSQDREDIYKFRSSIAKNAFFLPRSEAEEDPDYKQIIPYTLVQNIYDKKILAYRRTKKSSEGRLHDNWSVGLGGHVNPQDRQYNGRSEYMNCMRRELREEVGLIHGRAAVIGLLYDPSNTVGRVHFGVVVAYLVIDDVVESMEPAIAENLKWVTVEEGLDLPRLENWSQMVLEKMNE